MVTEHIGICRNSYPAARRRVLREARPPAAPRGASCRGHPCLSSKASTRGFRAACAAEGAAGYHEIETAHGRAQASCQLFRGAVGVRSTFFRGRVEGNRPLRRHHWSPVRRQRARGRTPTESSPRNAKGLSNSSAAGGSLASRLSSPSRRTSRTRRSTSPPSLSIRLSLPISPTSPTLKRRLRDPEERLTSPPFRG